MEQLAAGGSEEVDFEEKERDTEYGKLFEKYKHRHEDALFEYCFLHNLFFDNTLIQSVIATNQRADVPVDLEDHLGELYQSALEQDIELKDKTFFSQLRRENFEQVYSVERINEDYDEETNKNRLAVIDILAYDPFLSDDKDDRPQLYRDMAGMLTENMRKDVAKAKAALSIVRSYNNLEKYQKKINDIMKTGEVTEETQKTLDQLIKIQKTLQDNINTTAEKNAFTVKGVGSNGKGMLSDVMNQIEERGIDEGITNFYDIETSKSIEEVANISFRAQLNQVNLSKTDYADILAAQCKMVREAQQVAREAKEALRLAKEKIVKQQLLKELEKEYRKKGISEKEIEQFIQREYHLYDGNG